MPTPGSVFTVNEEVVHYGKNDDERSAVITGLGLSSQPAVGTTEWWEMYKFLDLVRKRPKRGSTTLLHNGWNHTSSQSPAGHVNAPRDMVVPRGPSLHLIRVPFLCTTILLHPDMISSHKYESRPTETSCEKYPTKILQYRETYLTIPRKIYQGAELTKL